MNLVNIKNQAIQAQLSKEEQEKRLGFNFLNTVESQTMQLHLESGWYGACFELLGKMRDEKVEEYAYWRVRIEDDIIRTNNISALCEFAKKFPDANIKRKEQVLVDSSSSYSNGQDFCFLSSVYTFARDVQGADIKLLEDIIIKADTYVIVEFARDVKGANIQRLQNRVIELGDAFLILFFARDVKGANIKELEDAILKTKDYYLLLSFAREVKGANKTRIEKKMVELNNPECASFLLTHNLAKEHTQILEDTVFNGLDAEACLNLAKKRNDEKFKALVCKIADIGNVEICKRALKELDLNYMLQDILMFSIEANKEDVNFTKN